MPDSKAALATVGKEDLRIPERGIVLTCQLVSAGRPVILIRNAVRLGRGAVRSWRAKFSLRGRDPRANCTTSRSPMKSDPSANKHCQVFCQALPVRANASIHTEGCIILALAATQMRVDDALTRNLPGTTSRASIASLYSMKPKPFMSLISVISPVPWVAKCCSTSALVTAPVASQRRRKSQGKPSHSGSIDHRVEGSSPVHRTRFKAAQCPSRAVEAIIPLRGRFPRYSLVDDTSDILGEAQCGGPSRCGSLYVRPVGEARFQTRMSAAR